MKLNYERISNSNADAAKEVIITGLQEYFPEYDESLNPDLKEILSYYDEKRASLFVGRNDTQEIIATGALVYGNDKTVEIKRVSVKSKYRFHGFGKDVVLFLESTAFERGYQRVVLETTETWTGVVRFYLQNGYSITHRKDGDIYFEKFIS